MREIRMKTLSAGPEGVKNPGSLHTIAKGEAHDLVKGNFAEYTTTGPEETADARPTPRGRGKKGAAE